MEKESRMPLSLWKALTMTSEQVTVSIDELSLGRECLFFLTVLLGFKSHIECQKLLTES